MKDRFEFTTTQSPNLRYTATCRYDLNDVLVTWTDAFGENHSIDYPRTLAEGCLREKIWQVRPSVPAAIDQYTAACQAFEAAQLALEKAKAAVEDARNDLRDALDADE